MITFRVPKYGTIEGESRHVNMESPSSLTSFICVPSNNLAAIAHRTFHYHFVVAFPEHGNRPSAKTPAVENPVYPI